MEGWISTNERRPPPGDLVLLYTPAGDKPHKRRRIGWMDERGVYRSGGAFILGHNVTHWQSLPREPM